MDTSALKKFAQAARRQLLEQVSARMEQVLQIDSIEIREKEKVVKELQAQINMSSKETVIDQVAYTWFNRFCALRYMDVNHYTRIGIVSPVEGFTQPEILQEAKQGVIDDSFKVDKQNVIGLLNGQLPSSNPQQEAYRLLLVGACNAYHAQMPFLFPKIDDYTELLMPDDLLSEKSVLQGVREELTAKVCQDVEVIGWLYQFYISERKDEVFAALKKNKKIEAEDIPAATQLFTPHWIVRYLVENSLGRLWMINHPDSKLAKQMDYYIQPEELETDFLEINSPEEIKVCDPACGSGHMLTYAFDLLYAIYEEEGYDQMQIPGLILENNLYGIEIDQRAGHLAAFALMMKGREKDRRFFSREIEPNICVLENITFTPSEIDAYKKAIGQDLFTQELWFLLQQFEEAGNFGSLIRPQAQYHSQIRERLQELGIFDDMFLRITSEKVKQVLKFIEYLSPRYHVVVANPPYMGKKGMNAELRGFALDQFPKTKSDLFAMFIERNLDLARPAGILGMITMQSWMFLSSYEKFRERLIENETIQSMAHFGTRAFDTISGAVVSTTAFTLKNASVPDFKGVYIRLIYEGSEEEKRIRLIEAIRNPDCGWFYLASSADFKKIPGLPIAYWVSDKIHEVFINGQSFSEIAQPKFGISTANNEKYLRSWYEVNNNKIEFNASTKTSIGIDNSQKKWFPVNKGGAFRRWYGNHEILIDWEKDGFRLKNDDRAVIRNPSYYFREGMTWNDISSGKFNMRYSDGDSMFEGKGPMAFTETQQELYTLIALFNTKLTISFFSILSSTLNFNVGDISKFPILNRIFSLNQATLAKKMIEISKSDWDSFEISWNFSTSPLLYNSMNQKNLSTSFINRRSNWQKISLEMKKLEEENNRVFIETYGLQDELTPAVPIEEITLTCNPHYRYGGNKTKEELDTLLLTDTMKEYISYAVGCMLGRYSLDKDGLILANAGETLEDYLLQVPEPSFMPDEDNVIPVLDGEWFEDDIAERFKDFLKITFGEENFEENLAFLEEAIGRDIRGYFVKDFYSHHVKMYKKRPIYWLFSSPKGSFNALIYMHRYRPDTVSVILNDYLVQYREKLSAHKSLLENRSISANASQGEKTKAIKEIDQINKVLSELKEYEKEILYPLASERIEIDLDDGVKVNYNKFGEALKKIAGVSD